MNQLRSNIRYNIVKHHAISFSDAILRWRNEGLPKAIEEIQALGSNQIDIYTGLLTPGQMMDEICETLSGKKILSRAMLEVWLGKPGYKTISLSDGSRWVIREGTDPDKFIHVHPGRNQPLIRRVRASHLKTGLLICLIDPGQPSSNGEWDTPDLNKIRKNLLGLSPVRSASECVKLSETCRLVREWIR